MPALLIAKAMLGRAWGWLSRASFWQLVSICLCVFICVQHFQLVSARHSAVKWKNVAAQYKVQLDAETEQARTSEQAAQKLAKKIKDQTDEENRRIAGDAHALRVSGPGKALCRSVPTAPGNGASSANPDVTGPALPPDDRAAVPWNWLVQRAQEHDELLNETSAWRQWYQEVLKVWPKTTEQSK